MKEIFPLSPSDEAVQAVKVPFARAPLPTRPVSHTSTDRRGCYLMKGFLRHQADRGIPLALSVRRAYNEEEQELRVVSTLPDTESRSSTPSPSHSVPLPFPLPLSVSLSVCFCMSVFLYVCHYKYFFDCTLCPHNCRLHGKGNQRVNRCTLVEDPIYSLAVYLSVSVFLYLSPFTSSLFLSLSMSLSLSLFLLSPFAVSLPLCLCLSLSFAIPPSLSLCICLSPSLFLPLFSLSLSSFLSSPLCLPFSVSLHPFIFLHLPSLLPCPCPYLRVSL